jgi:hypothetical protein
MNEFFSQFSLNLDLSDYIKCQTFHVISLRIHKCEFCSNVTLFLLGIGFVIQYTWKPHER